MGPEGTEAEGRAEDRNKATGRSRSVLCDMMLEVSLH